MSDLQQDQSEFNVLFVHSDIDDYPLTTEEFRVYAHIARRAGLGEAWPSIDSIAKKCRIHPDTARRCIHSLTAYGLLSVEDRSKLGKSNKYRLTKKSLWRSAAEVQALQDAQTELGKSKRAARKTVKKTAVATPSETKGGVVNEGRGSERREAPVTEGGGGVPPFTRPPSETKGDEVYPLSDSIQGNPEKREKASSTPALPSDSGKNLEHAATNPQTQVTASEMRPAQEPPQANAGESGTQALEQVPGGGAAAGESTEKFLRRKFSHRFVDDMLAEIQPFGVNRGVDWFALPLARVVELAQEATRTHKEFKIKVPTRLKDLLDQEVQRAGLPALPEQAPVDDDGKIDMATLIASAPLNGRRTR